MARQGQGAAKPPRRSETQTPANKSHRGRPRPHSQLPQSAELRRPRKHLVPPAGLPRWAKGLPREHQEGGLGTHMTWARTAPSPAPGRAQQGLCFRMKSEWTVRRRQCSRDLELSLEYSDSQDDSGRTSRQGSKQPCTPAPQGVPGPSRSTSNGPRASVHSGAFGCQFCRRAGASLELGPPNSTRVCSWE